MNQATPGRATGPNRTHTGAVRAEACAAGFDWGAMEGALVDTGRRWQIVQDSSSRWSVWYAGCEYGGTFRSYAAAVASVRPWEAA